MPARWSEQELRRITATWITSQARGQSLRGRRNRPDCETLPLRLCNAGPKSLGAPASSSSWGVCFRLPLNMMFGLVVVGAMWKLAAAYAIATFDSSFRGDDRKKSFYRPANVVHVRLYSLLFVAFESNYLCPYVRVCVRASQMGVIWSEMTTYHWLQQQFIIVSPSLCLWLWFCKSI